MEKAKLIYRDTRNYLPIDVVKGIDASTKQIVMADDEAPADSEKMPKCKYCKNFTPDQKDKTGFCEASKNHFFAYPDMIAVTCQSYTEK